MSMSKANMAEKTVLGLTTSGNLHEFVTPKKVVSSSVSMSRHLLPIRKFSQFMDEKMKRHPEDHLSAINEETEEDSSEARPQISVGLNVVILGTISVIALGPYLAYDFAGATAPVLRDDYGYNTTDISALYSAYAAPSTVLVIAGGLMIDSLGIGKSFILLVTVYMVGLSLLVGSTYAQNFPTTFGLMVTAYVLISAQESLMVLQSKVIGLWFRENFLSRALAVANSITRLGTVIAISALPTIASKYGLPNAAWCVFGIVSSAFVVGSIGLVAFFHGLKLRSDPEQIENQDGRRVSWSDIKNLPKGMFLLVGLASSGHISMQLYSSFSVDILTQKFGYSDSTAGLLGAIQMAIALFFTPVVAVFTDVYGKRVILNIVGSFVLIPLYLVVAWTDVTPIPFNVLIGFVYSISCATVYPMVVLMIPDALLGTGFALLYAGQNISILIAALILGAVKDATGSYGIPITVLACYAMIALFIGVLLLIYDKVTLHGILQTSSRRTWKKLKVSDMTNLDPTAVAFELK